METDTTSLAAWCTLESLASNNTAWLVMGGVSFMARCSSGFRFQRAMLARIPRGSRLISGLYYWDHSLVIYGELGLWRVFFFFSSIALLPFSLSQDKWRSLCSDFWPLVNINIKTLHYYIIMWWLPWLEDLFRLHEQRSSAQFLTPQCRNSDGSLAAALRQLCYVRLERQGPGGGGGHKSKEIPIANMSGIRFPYSRSQTLCICIKHLPADYEI